MNAQTIAAVPDHVPPELVVDFDYFTFAVREPDMHRAWKRLHEGPPLFWTPHHGGHWVATRAEDLKVMYADYERFTSNHESIPRAQTFLIPPVEFDPPNHAQYRSLIVSAFSPKAIDKLKGLARSLTVDLIEGFRQRGSCEFYSDFALHMPIGIFLSIVDLPDSDRLRMLGWAEQGTRGTDVRQVEAAFAELYAYMDEKFQERRERPGDDLLSRLCQARIDGKPLTHEEMLGFGLILLNGGLDTVAASLGFIARHLADYPAERRRLIDAPELIPRAVDEIFRRFAITNLARRIVRDIEYRGVRLRAGDVILLPTVLYNLDESVYPRPFELDYERPDSGYQLGFGWGPHRCIGMSLARAEMRVFLEEWLGRIPDFHVPAGGQVEVRTGKVSAVTRLPLAWDPAATRGRALTPAGG